MKDIQKALEKARLEQHRTPRATPPSPSPTAAAPTTAAPATAASAPARDRASGKRPAAPAPETAATNRYRETRVLAPETKLLENHRIVAGLGYHELADTFRVLRTRILHRLDAEHFTTLGVTSANRGEGKTLTATNLAISLALNVTRTVLLVDLDFRAPRVHRYLGIDPQPGLVDYLENAVPLANCLVNPGIERLVVLPAGRPVPGSSELLSTPRMTHLADELKTRYADRIVIYDFPPVLASDDALTFMHHVDCCLLVVAEGGTAKPDLLQALDFMEGVPIIGTVLNKSKTPTKNYYYDPD